MGLAKTIPYSGVTPRLERRIRETHPNAYEWRRHERQKPCATGIVCVEALRHPPTREGELEKNRHSFWPSVFLISCYSQKGRKALPTRTDKNKGDVCIGLVFFTNPNQASHLSTRWSS